MNIASFLNLAGPDVVIIAFVVTLLFGASKLPELAKGVGQAIREFNKAKDDPS
jgi:sec-independent protein translocase protein TatA